jgi:hypothetical protein
VPRKRDGVGVRPTGAKSYVVVYRAGSGRRQGILGAVANGHDPARQKTSERGTPTVAERADRFMAEHVKAQEPDGEVLPGHSGSHREAGAGHCKGIEVYPVSGRQAAMQAALNKTGTAT